MDASEIERREGRLEAARAEGGEGDAGQVQQVRHLREPGRRSAVGRGGSERRESPRGAPDSEKDCGPQPPSGLPDSMREEIAKVQKEMDLPGVRLVKPGLIHVTIKFLGTSFWNRTCRSPRGRETPGLHRQGSGGGAFPGRSIRVSPGSAAEGDFKGLFSAVEEAPGPPGLSEGGAEVHIPRHHRPGREAQP